MLYFYKKTLILIVVLILTGCSNQQSSKESTWTNDTYKLTMLTQCVAFTKIGTTDPKQMSRADADFIIKIIKKGINVKSLDKSTAKASLCCHSYIKKHYSQEFFMGQENVAPIIDEALSSCN